MLDTTLEIFRAGLRADPTVSPVERARLLALFRSGAPAKTTVDHAPAPARIIRRDEVAQRLACSLRAVDRWSTLGHLRKIRLPGHSRAVGFREADVIALINGQEAGEAK
jgi:predicted DNA-binding transcriptional regulator AlpA